MVVKVHSRKTPCMWECFELTRCGAACEQKLSYNLASNSSSSSSSQLRRVRWWDCGGGGGILEGERDEMRLWFQIFVELIGVHQWRPFVHEFVFFVVEGWRDLSCKLLYLCATIFYFILFFLEFLKEQIIYLIPKGLGLFIEYRD